MMLRTEGMMRNEATAKMPNSSFICVLSVPAQNATRTAMPTASPTSVNIGESAAIVALRCRTRMISSIERSKSLSIAG